jgi:hypothetical protein
MHKWRTNICSISNATQNKLNYLESRETALLEKMRHADITRSTEKIDKRLMLDALQMEAIKHWPSLANLHRKINADVVIPQTVLNNSEYSKKLQRLAMYAE